MDSAKSVATGLRSFCFEPSVLSLLFFSISQSGAADEVISRPRADVMKRAACGQEMHD
jgi:hypothetical protein